MNYGFLIRNDRCIGCHACSTACKSENDVPVGVNRTWVKSVEKGRFPDVHRQFQVTRCNHCAHPPCVSICPVTAMYKRPDGIVEFDPDQCIGCKACLQACPYDAIYIDPDSGTAAKCHYCAHRTDVGLEPACVVVCPEHAIVSGDLDDPVSEISRMLATHEVTVRKPEQGTVPQLFYVDGDDLSLRPTAVERTPRSFAWADVVPLDGPAHAPLGGNGGDGGGGAGRDGGRRPGGGGPIQIGGGRMAGEMVRPFYNAQHRVPWHWPVPAYLVTKGIAAGVFMILALGALIGLFFPDPRSYLSVGAISLLFTAITTGLLVYDLERPERFLRVLTRPQWRSWLTRGAYLLVAFTLLVAAWWIAELGTVMGWWDAEAAQGVRPWALGVGSVLAAGVAAYTAFLFGQAEGRDLWQSPLLPIHLLTQAVLAGAATLLIAGPVLRIAPTIVAPMRWLLLAVLAADWSMIVFGEMGMRHASDDAARAAREIREGRYRETYALGVLLLGHVAPLGLLAATGHAFASASAGALALVGLYLYEHLFVSAPQRIPNS